MANKLEDMINYFQSSQPYAHELADMDTGLMAPRPPMSPQTRSVGVSEGDRWKKKHGDIPPFRMGDDAQWYGTDVLKASAFNPQTMDDITDFHTAKPEQQTISSVSHPFDPSPVRDSEQDLVNRYSKMIEKEKSPTIVSFEGYKNMNPIMRNFLEWGEVNEMDTDGDNIFTRNKETGKKSKNYTKQEFIDHMKQTIGLDITTWFE